MEVNISLVDLLTSMPKYAKFIKDMIVNKKRLLEKEVIPLSETCSCVI